MLGYFCTNRSDVDTASSDCGSPTRPVIHNLQKRFTTRLALSGSSIFNARTPLTVDESFEAWWCCKYLTIAEAKYLTK